MRQHKPYKHRSELGLKNKPGSGKKPIYKNISLCIGDNIIGQYETIADVLKEKPYLTKAGISQCLTGKRTHYKGFEIVAEKIAEKIA